MKDTSKYHEEYKKGYADGYMDGVDWANKNNNYEIEKWKIEPTSIGGNFGDRFEH